MYSKTITILGNKYTLHINYQHNEKLRLEFSRLTQEV